MACGHVSGERARPKHICNHIRNHIRNHICNHICNTCQVNELGPALMELGYTTVTKVAVARIMVKFQARPSETLNMFEFVKLAEYINSYQKVDASIRAAFEKYASRSQFTYDLGEVY